jgi:hypothetical protein
MRKGLTLIELLVASGVLVLLIGVVSFIAVPTQIGKAEDARRKADLDRIKVALYDYYFDNDCFPEEDEIPGCNQNFGTNGEVYLRSFPCDPSGSPYRYVVRKGGGKCKQWFRVFTNLEVISDSAIDKIHCRTGCGPDGDDPDNQECDYNYGVSSTNTQVYRNCSDAYVCAPGGSCEKFEDPWMSGCPAIFSTKAECEAVCDKDNDCDNASGKTVPWE